MRSIRTLMLCGLCAFIAGALSLGCDTTSHKTVRTYEYDDTPKEKRSESDKLDSEYKMESEGEMKGRD